MSVGSWRSFHIEGKQHWIAIDDREIFTVAEKDYFNKNTYKINIVKGFECDDFGKILSENIEILLIQIMYSIQNYFGNKSGKHIRSKEFVIYQGKIYNDKGEEVKKVTKEAQGALNEYQLIKGVAGLC